MAEIRARRKAERPGQILEAAFDEFVARGYAAARLEDVAARIGVTKGTIYFYFDGKEALFEAALQAVADRSWAEMSRREVRSTGDFLEDIRSFLADLSRFVVENPRSRESFRLLVAEGDRFPDLVELYFRSFMGPIEDMLRTRLGQALRDGELRPGLDHLTELILSPPLALQVMLLLFPDRLPVDREAFFRTHIDMLAAGILAEAGPAAARGVAEEAGRTDVDEPGPGPRWTEWRPFPDPRRGEMLIAPFGPGLCEFRLAEGERLFIEPARNVASRVTTLVPWDVPAEGRKSSSRRNFLVRHLAALRYRTMGCRSYAEAEELARSFDGTPYRFPRTRPSHARVARPPAKDRAGEPDG